MIKRNHYIAQLKAGVQSIDREVDSCRKNAEQLIAGGSLLTAALYHYENMLFLYYEEVCGEGGTEGKLDDGGDAAVAEGDIGSDGVGGAVPETFMGELIPYLESWPQAGGLVCWMRMFHIYYHSIPKSVEQWQQDRHPEHRRGRIAKLREDKLFGYVYHHVAIVNEGLLRGDKYQSIALYGDILFSYFEEPRSSVNIKEDYEHESKAIEEWQAVDPESHFIPFPEAQGANFLIIPEYFAVGR